MNLDRVPSGSSIPNDVNVIIEIPMHAPPIKYEVNKETGAMFVDRFMWTAMHYPCNYGYIPRTLAGDGDPVDVLVLSPVPLITGVVVRCRPVGMLKMEDDAGDDTKLLAVHHQPRSSKHADRFAEQKTCGDAQWHRRNQRSQPNALQRNTGVGKGK